MQARDERNQTTFQHYITYQDSSEANGWLDEDDDEGRGSIDPPILCPNPKCKSSGIKRFTTMADHTVLRCPHCKNYFCFRCQSLQTNKAALDTQSGFMRCQKCGIRL